MDARPLAVGILALLSASCAAPAPTAAPQPSDTVASASGSVAASTAAASPESIAASTAAASPESMQATSTNIDGSCPADEPFIASLKSVAATATTVIGTAQATGRYLVASPDSFATNTKVVYSEVKVHVERQLIGPKVGDDLTVYLPGGSSDGFKTTVGSVLESSWASDGEFFGTIRPSDAIAGGYAMESLPLVGATITFPGTGCRTPTGLSTVQTLSRTIVALNDGKVVQTSGQFKTAQLAEVDKLLG